MRAGVSSCSDQAWRTFDAPVVSDRPMLESARELLAKLRKARRVPAWLIGVSLSGLATDPMADQLALFSEKGDAHTESDRDRTLARAVDRVREKFGDKGIIPASLARPETRR